MKLKAILFTVIVFLYWPSVTAGIDLTDLSDTTIIVPAKVDSTNYYYLDINNDNITDFIIGARHFESFEGYHPPYDAYMVFIQGTNNNLVHEIPLFENDTIDTSLSFQKYSNLYGIYPGFGLVGMWPYRLETPYTTAYLGLQIIDQEQINHAWVELKTDGLSFTISRYAFNNSDGELIITGSTE